LILWFALPLGSFTIGRPLGQGLAIKFDRSRFHQNPVKPLIMKCIQFANRQRRKVVRAPIPQQSREPRLVSRPAAEMEKFVLSQIRSLGTDPEFAESVLEQIGSVATADLDGLRERERIANAEVRQCEADIHKLATNSVAGPEQAPRLASAQERQRKATERLYAIRDEIRDCERVAPDEEVVRQALRDFDPVWNAIAPREQQRVLNILVQRVDYNGESGNVEITFEPDGFDVFLAQFSERQAVA